MSSVPLTPSAVLTLSRHVLCHRCLQANKTRLSPFCSSSCPSSSTLAWLGRLPFRFPLVSWSWPASALLLALSSSRFSQVSHTPGPAPGPQALFLHSSHTWPLGVQPRFLSSVISWTCSKLSLSRKRFARPRMVSSKV